MTSRPESPKSDTEYENSRIDDHVPVTDDLHWQWGELPERKRSVSSANISGIEAKDGLCTILNSEYYSLHVLSIYYLTITFAFAESPLDEKGAGGLFNFMKSTKKIRHQPEKEGIYLSDLNLDELDPEIASLYLYKG